MTMNFKRPLTVFFPSGDFKHPDVDVFPNGKALYSLFYDRSDASNYSFVTDPTKAEVLCVSFHKYQTDLKPGIQSLMKQFTNLKLIVWAEVFHIGECMSGHENRKITERLHHLNIDPDLPLIMMISMDSYYHRHKNTPHMNCIFYSDYIYNTMQMLYKDQPHNLFDEKSHPGVHWWQEYADNDTLGLRRENYKLHDLTNLPDWDNIKTNAGSGGVPKLFVSPSRTRYTEIFNRHLSAYKDLNSKDHSCEKSAYEHRDYLRQELQAHLSNYPGFIGNGSNNTFLVGEGLTPMQLANNISNMNSPGNVPINNEYYRHSVLTINIETLTFGDHRNMTPHCVTEKTFETILKGHFPLTFAYQHYYQDLTDIYKIELPDWIDYDFDSEYDNLKRWIKYKLEVTRVLNLGAEKLFGFRNSQVDTLMYNRAVILDKTLRYTTHDAITEFLNHCKTQPYKSLSVINTVL